MSEKFRIVHLRENPIRKKRKVGRRRKRAPAPTRRRATSSRRRRKYASSRARKTAGRGFIVEGLQKKGGHVHFVYWTGHTFSSKRRAAKTYRTEKEANKACHASMKRRAASYLLARVVSA